MLIPLEDLYSDVIGKAQRGLGIDDQTLAGKSGVDAARIAAIKDGEVDENAILKLAPALSVHGPSLVTMAKKAWRPKDAAIDGLAQFNTVYDDMTVNAYVAWDPNTLQAAVFDTGADSSPILDLIKEKGLKMAAIFLTHTHPDHVADLDKLGKECGNPPVLVSEREPQPGAKTFAIGSASNWEIGGLKIEARSTWGHSRGGTTFVITGLAHPVAIVGDALFASSMGGGGISYADALATNRKEIFSLPDDTIVCPGHGPLTTVGEEKAHNPFYPEFK